MNISRPSPSMVVSIIALVFAMTGTGIAAVNFATNAGAVDGKSAVADGASRSVAAGRLVATQRSGDEKGRIASRYLDPDLARGATSVFGKAYQVADNQTLAPEALGSIPGLGQLTASCTDQNGTAGKEDPGTTLVFATQSGDAVNFSRTIGSTAPEIGALATGAQHQFSIGGSSTFELHVERKGTNYFVKGVVRQDGRNTDNASCLVYGFSLATSG